MNNILIRPLDFLMAFFDLLFKFPQLINILKGHMSFVGPRTNLCNQDGLITEREQLGVYDVFPSITGLVQINTINMSTPKLIKK